MRVNMKVKLLASAAVAGLLAAGAAQADPNGWYGAVDAGAHWVDDYEMTSDLGPVWDWSASPRI